MTTSTLTLTDFLLARIAEREEAAKAAAKDGPVWDDGGPGAIENARTVVTSDGSLAKSGRGVAEVEPHALPHVLLHDPAQVLAECKAKRRIVEVASRWTDDIRVDIAFDEVLGLLALPYADHPNYREEWAP